MAFFLSLFKMCKLWGRAWTNLSDNSQGDFFCCHTMNRLLYADHEVKGLIFFSSLKPMDGLRDVYAPSPLSTFREVVLTCLPFSSKISLQHTSLLYPNMSIVQVQLTFLGTFQLPGYDVFHLVCFRMSMQAQISFPAFGLHCFKCISLALLITILLKTWPDQSHPRFPCSSRFICR